MLHRIWRILINGFLFYQMRRKEKNPFIEERIFLSPQGSQFYTERIIYEIETQE